MSVCASLYVATAVVTIGMLASAALGLQCFQCGQYNDGVGSITPCINYTHMQLKECPRLDHRYCIKYVSEGSTVRDCVQSCTEKEHWGTRTFCCDKDACNSATSGRGFGHAFTVLAAAIVTAAAALLLSGSNMLLLPNH